MLRILLILIVVMIACGGCSSPSKKMLAKSAEEQTYSYEDKSGQFILKRQHKFIEEKNYYLTKSELIDPAAESQENEQTNVLENTAAISNPGSLGGVPIMRPYLSQHHVWFDGQRYSSEIRLNPEKKRLEVKLRSPEEKWNGNKNYLLPKGTGAFCFYSQLVDCIAFTGFFEKAVDNEGGEMNLHIIWDGFPYFMEQVQGMPTVPVSPASIQYDGVLDKEFYRFIVEHNDQTFFLVLDKQMQFNKLLWVAQGLSIIKE